MSHELEDIDGAAAMAFTGSRENIWHRLGTEVPDDITPDEMLKKAKVDWTVSKQPLYLKRGNKTIETTQRALVRDSDDKILDFVSKDWNPVQNTEAFEFFNEWVADGLMKMDSAGSLKGGQIVWANAKLGEEFDLFNGDVVRGYLLFTNPHRFGQSINIRTCMTRTVCWNTISAALREDSKNNFSQSHRTVFDADQVKLAMGVSKERLAKFKEQAAFLGAKLYTVDQMIEYFTTVFPVATTEGRKQRSEVSKNAKKAQEVVATQPGANFAEGSFWQLLNATTYMIDHVIGKSEDSRQTSAIYGVGASKKQQALKLALEMAS